MEQVCIFCGASRGASPAFARAAREIGVLCVSRDIGVVYGGGSVGLMGVLADAVLGAGGRLVGVIPQALAELELAHRGATELHVVASMHERKMRMHDLSDGFVALPGGLGTLEETLEALTWLQLGYHAKPVGLLNVEGYFDALLAMLDHATRQELIRPAQRAMIVVDESPRGLLERFEGWQPPSTPRWIEREQT